MIYLDGSKYGAARSGRRERIRALIAAMAAAMGVVLAGCGDDDSLGPICTAQAVFGINLTVLDGSGSPAAQGAVGVAIEASFADTLLVLGDSEMAGAVERPGTYDVTVARAGHASWSATGVTVTADECHVIPVHFDVNLVPVP